MSWRMGDYKGGGGGGGGEGGRVEWVREMRNVIFYLTHLTISMVFVKDVINTSHVPRRLQT